MSKQLTKTQQQLLADIKGVIARGRAVELFPDCLIGLDTGPCLSVEVL